MKVLSLGSICLDILNQNINEFPKPNHVTQVDTIKLMGGGGALNTAIALKRLGLDSYPMGELGKDYAGKLLQNIMEEESLNTSYLLHKEEKSTCVINVIINKEGERSFICNPGNFLRIKYDDYDWDILQHFDALVIGSCFLLDDLLPDLPKVLSKCREHNVISVVDTVWPTRQNHHEIMPSLPYIDYFTPSFEEAQVLSGYKNPQDIADWCIEHGSTNVIIKMDKQGCYLANDKLKTRVPALSVELKDSTGAGDCFIAGLIKGLSLNYDIIKAAQLANSAGAMCVQSLGAYTGITNFDNLISKYMVHYEKEPINSK